MTSDIDKLALRLETGLQQAVAHYSTGNMNRVLTRMQKDLAQKHWMFREYVFKNNHVTAKKYALEILAISRQFEEMFKPKKPLTIDLKLDWM